jgi:proteasome regulatory subunit
LANRVDPAVLRGGRLDRKIEIPLPDVDGRLALLKLHSRRLQLAPDIDFSTVAAKTEGLSGADIESLCNAAGEFAFIRAEDPRQVTQADFVAAADRVVLEGSRTRQGPSLLDPL